MHNPRTLFIMILSLVFSPYAGAVTWEVATPGTPGCSDTICTPCCSIQAAIEHASGGDTVNVDSGTFNEKLAPQNMSSMGSLTLTAADGPGTVLVIPPTDEGIVTTFFTGTLTVDGLSFSAATDCGVYLNQTGPVVLRDVTANNCGYTAFCIDATGPVTLERCSADSSARSGIQVDGASSATLTDCTATNNPSDGIVVLNVTGTAEVLNPTTTGNLTDGLSIDTYGPVVIDGATSSGNGRDGVVVTTDGTVTVSNSIASGNSGRGFYVGGWSVGVADGLTMTNCTASNNGIPLEESGVDVEGVSGPTQLTNCTANDNGNDGISIDDSVTGTLEISGGESKRNLYEGYSLWSTGGITVSGVTSADNGRRGLNIETPGAVTITDATVTGNTDQGVDVNWDGADLVDSLTMTGCAANDNGHGSGDTGVRIRNVAGPTVLADCIANDNGADGISAETSVAGTLQVTGGEAKRNADDGYDLRAAGDITVIDVVAQENTYGGIEIDNGGSVLVEDCVTTDNLVGTGLTIAWQDPDRLDGVTVRRTVASGNGIGGGGYGIEVAHVDGGVVVTDTELVGNSRSGLGIDDASASVLISGTTSSSNQEHGVFLAVDGGPVRLIDSHVQNNANGGAVFLGGSADIDNLEVRRSSVSGNGSTGLVFLGLAVSGGHAAQCNEVAGNTGGGLYLDTGASVDARNVWWGDASGPSGEGPGTGDSVDSGPGTVLIVPWLEGLLSEPDTDCELFRTGMDSGSIDEWNRHRP